MPETHTNKRSHSGFACFGELLLRLSPPRNELLLQSGALDVHIGGAAVDPRGGQLAARLGNSRSRQSQRSRGCAARGKNGARAGTGRVIRLQLPAPPQEKFQMAAEYTLAEFPHLQRIASMVRTQRSVDAHDLAAKLMTRTGPRTTRTYRIGRIIDRIGSGDAFAAGLLHGLETGLDDQAGLDFGLAAACLKHSIPGDFNLVGVADVHNLLRDTGFTVRR
jgi:hypothetical protein